MVRFTLGMWLNIPREHYDNPLSAAAWWVRQGKDRRWRAIIYYLDRVGETGLADVLMPYSEPPSDSSLTVQCVAPIFMNMSGWRRRTHFLIVVPDARAEVIRQQYPSEQDQKRQGASYYVNIYPWASWKHLAEWLYRCRESTAIEAFKIQLPKPKDPTLTMKNMMTATEGVKMSEYSSYYLDMPRHEYSRIIDSHGTGRDGREAVFAEFLSHHPYPTWEVVIKLLEELENEGNARAGLAQEVKEQYLKSVHSLFNLCVGHIVNNYELYQPLLPQFLPPHILTHICSLPSWQQQESRTSRNNT